MKAPYFTVLIDAYNYGRYVEEAVSSVLAQDFPAAEREILVVDDGSTDDTAARLQKFGNAIRYLYKSNGGQASAFNYGFANARGEVIALLDADDVWLPQKLSRIYDTFQQNPAAGMAYHRLYWWDGQTKSRRTATSFLFRGSYPKAAAHSCNIPWPAPRVSRFGARRSRDFYLCRKLCVRKRTRFWRPWSSLMRRS